MAQNVPWDVIIIIDHRQIAGGFVFTDDTGYVLLLQ